MHLVLNIFYLSEVVLFSLFNICLCLLSDAANAFSF